MDDAAALHRYGTTQPAPSSRTLTAGALSCRLEDGAVRGLRWHGTELIRGVAYLLRDANWATAACSVKHLEVHEQAERFEARFELSLALPDGTLIAHAHVEGTAAGHFAFEVEAHAAQTLQSNRCGFVVLHPAGVAGTPLTVEHIDGSVEDTVFPWLISPAQPVLGIRALQHEARPGLRVSCRLDAELPGRLQAPFEMEDQRNWSDASFKTYVGSLLDPWPYAVPAGRRFRQRVQVDVQDEGGAVSTTTAEADTPLLRLGPPVGVRLPAIGLGVPLGLAALTDDERSAVLALRPAWLQAEVDIEAPTLQLQAIARLAAVCGAQIQLEVLCPPSLSPADAAGLLARACASVGCTPQAVRPCPTPYLKSYQPAGPWPELPALERYASAFAAAFPRCHIGGGMLSYFTELNRKRPAADALDFIGHSTCPIVHAADDHSVIETLESLPHIVRSVQALWPTLAYRLGPVTLAMHRNPYGDGPVANPERQRLAMAAEDPRHQAAFGAAWMVGYTATVAPFGLEVLSLHHSHGINGPLLRAGPPGGWVPAWRVQQVLAAADRALLLPLDGLPTGVAGLAWAAPDGGRSLLLANLGEAGHTLCLDGVWLAHDLSHPGRAEAVPHKTAVHDSVSLSAWQVLHLQA